MIIKNSKKSMNPASEEAFIQLVNRNQDKMYRMAYSYVKNKDDALELVQETVYKAYLSYHKVRNKSFEDTWLIRILINNAMDLIRQKKKIIPMFREDLQESSLEITNEVENRMLVNEALEVLNEVEKTVIILRYFEDLKLMDVAKILDKPVNTIKSTLYRALEKMKIEISEVN